MQIDWTTISTLVIGFLAINGFLRGWWKEAFTTAALTILVVLVQQPTWAQQLIEWLNSGLAAVVGLLAGVSDAVVTIDAGALQDTFRIDPSQPNTWFVALVLFVGGAGILSRLFLPTSASKVPGQYYSVSFIGRLLGLGLGAVNGFLLLGLIREYLDGRVLPGQDRAAAAAASSIRVVGESPYGPPASSVSIQAVGLPDVTILDNVLPWVVIGGGLLVLLSVITSRVGILRSKEGWKMDSRSPYGHDRIIVFPPPPPRSPGGGG